MGRILDAGRVFHKDGKVAAAGTATFYATGTTALKLTYSNAAQTVANVNPITLDSDGRLPVEVFGSGTYTVSVKNISGGSVWSEDEIEPQASLGIIISATGVDQVTEIQAAIDGATSGDTVYFVGSTTFLISKALTPKDGVTLAGSATIKLADASNSRMVFADGVSNVTIRGLKFDGNNTNQTLGVNNNDKNLIFLTDTSNSTQVSNNHIIACEIRNSAENGIVFGASLRCSIRGCVITNNRLHGIATIGGTIKHTELCVFSDNIIEGYNLHNKDDPEDGGAGIIPMGTARKCVIANNTIRNTGPNGDGITAYSNDATNGNIGHVISGNFVENSHNHGIHVGADDQTVVGNTVIEAGLTSDGVSGIRIRNRVEDNDASRITISGNTVNCTNSNVAAGIDAFTMGNQVTITGNTVKNSGGTTADHGIGIRVDNGEKATITGNTVTGSGTIGILCNTFIRSVLSGNLVTDSNEDGIELIAATQCLISGNMVFNSGVSVGSGTGFALKTDAATDRTFVDGNVLRNTNESSVLSIASGTTQLIFGNNYYSDSTTHEAIATVASASTITLPPQFNIFAITGTTTINAINDSWEGREVTLLFSTTITINDQNPAIQLAGNFAANASDTLKLVFDGTTWFETSRSAN